MLSLRKHVARSALELDRIAPLWNALLKAQPHSLFQRFSWNRLAAQMFQDRATPYVVCVESDAGAAIIPAVINHASGHLDLLGETLFDYRDVLGAGDREILRLAWQQLAACNKPMRVVSVQGHPAESRWTDFPMSLHATAPQVASSQIDESAFRLAHSRLGRQLRRLKKLGISLRTYSGNDSAIVRHLYECKHTRFATDSDNLFLDPRRCEFMVAAAALEGSSCEVCTLESDSGTMVAGLVTFRDGGVRRCYTIYFHPEWARYSPGIALLYEATARSLAEGLTCDYMTGEYSYKTRLANSWRPLYKVELSAQELAHIAAEPVSSAA